MAIEIDYTKSGDSWIAYHVRGDGPIDLLYVSTFVSNLESWWMWPPLVEYFNRLASFSRLIMFDKRGTGLSDREGSFLTFDDVMQDTAAVLQAVGSDRAAVMGVGDAGATAAMFAATYPEKTTALVMYETFARRAWAPDNAWGISEEVLEQFARRFEQEWGRGPVGIELLAPSYADDPLFRDWFVRNARLAMGPSGIRSCLQMTNRIDVRHVLPTIGVPTLVVHKTGDRVVPVEHGRYLAETIPGAKLVEVPGEDHVMFSGMDPVLDEIEEFLTGHRSSVSENRVLATILFTDIVGSTERAAALGDREWRKLVDRHEAIVRHELARFRGVELRSLGDGFMVMFDGPARAVRCAHAVRDALGVIGIDIRAGLHTGECELFGSDVAGIAVHIAARVAAEAKPGEILVSSTVKDLVIGSELRFRDRGRHLLKGLEDDWQLFALDP